ncbi:substrate-binding domain-containing protein [Amaricoccus sp.]|uniref:substrate-binding domain-containing protein n=1 Tax=Amaricoccus sp. TaxID=1872485 RepID=UPI001B3DAB5C|nr:substrate-binding domain-containing protein [Amaricoccus sp.]MBP7000609.1 substrate-binding domain-containing protein [Amaricoccus sp.]
MKLKELSRLLNLSATTVSRALNGYPEVKEETRARVLAAARRHGYAPNQMARRLATGRAMAIGHVVPLAQRHVINPIFAEFVHGAGETYAARGYDMLVPIVPEDREAEVYEALARHHKVDGVIVHGPLPHEPRIDLLQRLGLPFLLHGRDDRPEDAYPWLDINNRRAFHAATELLLDLGHRRIALLNGPGTQNFARRRRRGYEEALASRGVTPDPRLIRASEMTELYGHAAARELLGGPEPPTAFLVSATAIAFGVLRAARELRLEPGRDVSIVTHDDELAYLANSGDPPLFTATTSSIRAAGRRAAEMLLALIDDPAGAPRQELWEVELTLGQSTGPVPPGR